jgi:hypothetical protein
VARLNEAVKKQKKGGTVWMQLFLALAHHRLDQRVSGARLLGMLAAPQGSGHLLALPALTPGDVAAKECLRRAVERIQDTKYPQWRNEVRWRYLRPEAEALVNQASGTGDAASRARP